MEHPRGPLRSLKLKAHATAVSSGDTAESLVLWEESPYAC